jgi:hypothetical protein
VPGRAPKLKKKILRFSAKNIQKMRTAALGMAIFGLKGLSHEIDFKNFDKNLQNLAYLRGSDDFIIQKVHLLRLMPVCVGLILVSCLFCQPPQLQVEYN